MDIITFVEDVLGVCPNDWQKDYLKRMYDIYKSDRDDFIIKCRRGQPTCMSVAFGLYETFKRYESNLDPYQRYELMHPRKKPRGSIRRNRR